MWQKFLYLAFSCVAGGLSPSLLLGQIEGRVQDENGIPISSATVELWSDQHRLDTSLTDEAGWFSFRPAPDATSVRVRALGMATIQVPLGDLLSPLDVLLYPDPVELTALEVKSSPFRCPLRDDPVARQIWEETLEPSRIPPDGSHWGAEIVLRKKGVTRIQDLGLLEVMPLGWWGEIKGTTGYFLRGPWASDTLEEVGYARRREFSSADGREVAWDYPELDGFFSLLFVAPHFLSNLTVGIGQSGSTGTTLRFCDEKRGHGGIRGQLFLDSSGEPIRAEWRFVTADPTEEAGGSVEFWDGTEYLFPRYSVFWRKTPTGRFFQVASWYSRWFSGSSEGLRQFLKERRESRGSDSSVSPWIRHPE